MTNSLRDNNHIPVGLGATTNSVAPLSIDSVTGRLMIEIHGIPFDYTAAVVTGSVTPNATGNYSISGTYNGQTAYVRNDNAYWIWYDINTNLWNLSTAKGTVDGWCISGGTMAVTDGGGLSPNVTGTYTFSSLDASNLPIYLLGNYAIEYVFGRWELIKVAGPPPTDTWLGGLIPIVGNYNASFGNAAGIATVSSNISSAAGSYVPTTVTTGTALIALPPISNFLPDRALKDANYANTMTGLDENGNLSAIAIDSATGYPIVDLIIE